MTREHNVWYENKELGIVIDEWFNDGYDIQGEVIIDSPFGKFSFMYDYYEEGDEEITISDHSYYVQASNIKEEWMSVIREQMKTKYGAEVRCI